MIFSENRCPLFGIMLYDNRPRSFRTACERAVGSRVCEKGREEMNKLIAGLALALAVGASGSSAQAGPWCAFYGPSTYNCGFQTYQQCYATVLGAGGWCRQNFFEPNAGAKPSGRKARVSRS
jgi:Protein of unknown function (DUF3551)